VPDYIVEYAYDGSRSYRIGYEDGKKYPCRIQSKHNNEDDGSKQPPLAACLFYKWKNGELYDYKPTEITREQLMAFKRERFFAQQKKVAA
jgi:hypothetical protein